jgi:hypothetical protein
MTESPWPVADEPLILAYLAGEVSDTDANVRELFARCPSLRGELQQLVSFAAAVDRAGRHERETWTAASDGTASGAELDAGPQPRGSATGRRWGRTRVAGAALLAASIAVGVWFVASDAARPERVLGVLEERARWPLRADEGFAEFAWRPAPVARCQVRVHFDDGREPIVHDVEGEVWRPSERDLARLRGAVRWEVWIERPGQLELWARATL